jgi:hypothetical protein
VPTSFSADYAHTRRPNKRMNRTAGKAFCCFFESVARRRLFAAFGDSVLQQL